MRALCLLLLFASILSGSNPVGYRQFTLEDDRRPAASIGATGQVRKITVSLWYPAREARHTRTWFSYFRDEAHLRDLLPPGAPLVRIRAALLAHTSLATANPSALQSRYLILIPASPGLIAPVAERLATHGYTVAAVEAQGTFEQNFIASLPDLQSLIEDLQFIRARVGAQLPYACLGHAIGATACAGLAMRDWSMKAVISWEGGLPTPFEQGLLRQLPYFDAAAFRAPLLLLHAPHPAIRPELLDPYVFTPQRRVSFPDSSEGHFLIWGALEVDVPGLLGEAKPKAPASLERALEYAVKFLDQILKAVEAEQPPAEERAGLPFRASLPELRDLLRREGVAGLRKLSEAMRPQVRISPAKLEALSQWLSWQNEPLKSQEAALDQLRRDVESVVP